MYVVFKEWKKLVLTYEYSARVESDFLRRLRAFMGVGVVCVCLGDFGMVSEVLYEVNCLNLIDVSVKVVLVSVLKLNGDLECVLEILREAVEL